METLKLSANRFFIKSHIPMWGILWFVIWVCTFPCHSQELLHKVGSLDVYDDHVQNIFTSDSLLFVLRADWDNKNGFSTNIYNIADLTKPYLIGRQHKETYEGQPEFQDRVVFLKDTGFQYPFFIVLSEDKTEAIHTFWYPNKVIESKTYFYEFRSFDREVRIHQAVSPTTFQQVKSYSLSISNPVFTGLALVKDVIYLATRNAGLIVLDARDVNSVTELSSPITEGNFVRIISGNHKIWLENDSGEIIELDVLNPDQPEITRTMTIAGFRLAGFWSDGKFYLKGKKNILILDAHFNMENTVTLREPDFADSFIKMDSTLFVSTNYGVDIYNLADERCKRMSRIGKSTCEAFHFEKRDNLLFIADVADGLTIVDITNVRQPQLLSRYYLNGNARDVKVAGDYVYVADYINGLVILDISQPEKPEWVSSLEIDDGVRSIDLNGETLFLSAAADGASVYAIVISNKSMPEIVHRQNVVPATPWISWYSNDNVLFAGGYVWCYFEDSPLFSFKYDSIDGFIPKAQFGDSPATGWGLASEIKAFDNLMYFLTESGILIIDMDTLKFIIEKPGFAAGYMSGPWPQSVAIQGDTLFISQAYQGGGGIEAYNMTNPAHPIQFEEYFYYDYWSSEIIFKDDYLYMLTTSGIEIYSPEEPVKVDRKNNFRSTELATFHLSQNYPNPFNASTTISYSLQKSGWVQLKIYDLSGGLVISLVNEAQSAGAHQVLWPGLNRESTAVASGIYFYDLSLQTKHGLSTQTRKLLLMR